MPIISLHSILSAVTCLIDLYYRQQSIRLSTELPTFKIHVVLSSK